jgi:hypothetical protein
MALTVPPSVAIAANTGGGAKAAKSPSPVHAWRTNVLAGVSLDAFLPPAEVARACAVAVVNAIRLVVFIAATAICLSVCACTIAVSIDARSDACTPACAWGSS